MKYPIFTEFLDKDENKINAFSLKEGDMILNKNFDSVLVTKKTKGREKGFYEITYQDNTKIVICKNHNLKFLVLDNIKEDDFFLDTKEACKEISLNKILSLDNQTLLEKKFFNYILSTRKNKRILEKEIKNILIKNNFYLSTIKENYIKLGFLKKKEEEKALKKNSIISSLRSKNNDYLLFENIDKLADLFEELGCLVSCLKETPEKYEVDIHLSNSFSVNVFETYPNHEFIETENVFPVKQIINIEYIGKYDSYDIATDLDEYLINGEYNII